MSLGPEELLSWASSESIGSHLSAVMDSWLLGSRQRKRGAIHSEPHTSLPRPSPCPPCPTLSMPLAPPSQANMFITATDSRLWLPNDQWDGSRRERALMLHVRGRQMWGGGGGRPRYNWVQVACGYHRSPWTGSERLQVMSTCNARDKACVANMFCIYRPGGSMRGLLAFKARAPWAIGWVSQPVSWLGCLFKMVGEWWWCVGRVWHTEHFLM